MVLLCAVWGVQQVGTKVAIAGGLSPMFQAAARSALGAALLLLWSAGRGELRRVLRQPGSLPPGLLIGGLFGLEFLLLFQGVAGTTASRAVLLLYTAPFFTALGAHLLLPGERLRARQGAGLLLAFGGVAVAVADAPSGAGATWAGDAMVTAAAALWGVTTVTIKRSPALVRAPAATVLLYQLVGCAALAGAAGVIAGQIAGVPRGTALAWASVLYQGAIVSFASYLAWFGLVARYPAGPLSAFTFLTPLLGIAAGVALLREPAHPSLLLAVLCVAAGLRLVNRPAS